MASANKEWWRFWGKSEGPKPVSESKIVAVKDLPIYPPAEDLSAYRFVEEPQAPLQPQISRVRVRVQHSYDAFMEKFTSVQNFVSASQTVATKSYNYVRDEGTVIPKAIAITVGGMGGFLYGMRRGGLFKRTGFSALGLSLTAAFCYPNETVDVVRTGVAHTSSFARRKWDDFAASPVPPPPAAKTPVEKNLSTPSGTGNNGDSSNADMYTTRTS